MKYRRYKDLFIESVIVRSFELIESCQVFQVVNQGQKRELVCVTNLKIGKHILEGILLNNNLMSQL